MQLQADSRALDFYYDENSKRYRYRDSQQFAPKRAVDNLTRDFITETFSDLSTLGDELYSLRITLSEYQRRFAEKVKDLHIAQAALGKGGYHLLTSSDYLDIGRRLKNQYYAGIDPLTGRRYGIRHFVNEILAGTVSKRMLLHRMKRFGLSSKASFWSMARNRAIQNGRTKARRKRNAQESCPECISYEALGVVNIEDAILPTEFCSCGPNCRCTLTFT